MAQAERERMRVVMFPWLAHGHINPFLELARRLTTDATSDVDVVVHLVSTPANLASLARHQTDKINLVELHLPALPDLPPALHTTKRLPPRLMPALKRACDLAAPRFGALLDDLRPVDLLLYDFLQPWAPLEAAARGVPAVHFSTCSAAANAFFVHCLKRDRVPSAFPFEAIGLGGAEEEDKYTALLAIRDDGGTALVPERDRLPLSLERSCGFVAVKTCAEIERKYMDYLSQLVGKEVVPTGPLLADCGVSQDKHGGDERVMRWLDGEQPGSVVLVSFGTEYFMSEDQMAQMARGLELSGVPFVWVVRFPGAEDNARGAARSMPPTAARGMVVEWVPQRRALSHPSCGAFLTHCGWSSVMESMAAGVPMVALPLHLDQPLNANLAAEVGAAAARVKQDWFGEFTAEEVARAVRATVNGEEGKTARRRARKLQEVVARNDGDDAQIAALLQRMARLCGKGQAVPNQ